MRLPITRKSYWRWPDTNYNHIFLITSLSLTALPPSQRTRYPQKSSLSIKSNSIPALWTQTEADSGGMTVSRRSDFPSAPVQVSHLKSPQGLLLSVRNKTAVECLCTSSIIGAIQFALEATLCSRILSSQPIHRENGTKSKPHAMIQAHAV